MMLRSYPKELLDFLNTHFDEDSDCPMEQIPFVVTLSTLVKKPHLLAWFKYYDQQDFLPRFVVAFKSIIKNSKPLFRSKILQYALTFLKEHHLQSNPTEETLEINTSLLPSFAINWLQSLNIYFQQPQITATSEMKYHFVTLIETNLSTLSEEEQTNYIQKIEDLILQVFFTEFKSYIHWTENCPFDEEIFLLAKDQTWSPLLAMPQTEPSHSLKVFWKHLFDYRDISSEDFDFFHDCLVEEGLSDFSAQLCVDSIGCEIDQAREAYNSLSAEEKISLPTELDMNIFSRYYISQFEALCEEALFPPLSDRISYAVEISQALKIKIFEQLDSKYHYGLDKKSEFFQKAIEEKDFLLAESIYLSDKKILDTLESDLALKHLTLFISCVSPELQSDIFYHFYRQENFTNKKLDKVFNYLLENQSFKSLKSLFKEIKAAMIYWMSDEDSLKFEPFEKLIKSAQYIPQISDLIENEFFQALKNAHQHFMKHPEEIHDFILQRYLITLLAVAQLSVKGYLAKESIFEEIMTMIACFKNIDVLSTKKHIMPVSHSLVTYCSQRDSFSAMLDFLNLISSHPKSYTIFLQHLLMIEKAVFPQNSDSRPNPYIRLSKRALFNISEMHLSRFFKFAPKLFIDRYWPQFYTIIAQLSSDSSCEASPNLKNIDKLLIQKQPKNIPQEIFEYILDLYSCEKYFSLDTFYERKTIILDLLFSNFDLMSQNFDFFHQKSLRLCHEYQFSDALAGEISNYSPSALRKRALSDEITQETNTAEKPAIKESQIRLKLNKKSKGSVTIDLRFNQTLIFGLSQESVATQIDDLEDLQNQPSNSITPTSKR